MSFSPVWNNGYLNPFCDNATEKKDVFSKFEGRFLSFLFFFLFLNNSRYTVSSSHFERIVNVLKIAYSDLSFDDVIHLPRYLRFFSLWNGNKCKLTSLRLSRTVSRLFVERRIDGYNVYRTKVIAYIKSL